MPPENPQVVRTKQAVLAAAADVLRARGFGGMTIDAVSAASGVARSTIYRHWPDLTTLAVDAFGVLAGAPPVAAPTGDVRQELVDLFGRLAHGVTAAPSLQVLPSLADAAQRDATLSGLLGRFIDAQREPAREIVRRAVDRGELPDGVNVEWLLDAVGGPLFYRQLVSRQDPGEEGLVEYLVDAALDAARSRAR